MCFLDLVYFVFIMNDFFWLIIIVVFLIFVGLLMLFFLYRGNKVNKWYIICICILEFFLMIYVFCYNFKMDDLLI